MQKPVEAHCIAFLSHNYGLRPHGQDLLSIKESWNACLPAHSGLAASRLAGCVGKRHNFTGHCLYHCSSHWTLSLFMCAVSESKTGCLTSFSSADILSSKACEDSFFFYVQTLPTSCNSPCTALSSLGFTLRESSVAEYFINDEPVVKTFVAHNAIQTAPQFLHIAATRTMHLSWIFSNFNSSLQCSVEKQTLQHFFPLKFPIKICCYGLLGKGKGCFIHKNSWKRKCLY